MHVVPPRLSGPASEPMRKPRRPASGNSTGVVREGEETGNDPDSNLAKYRRAPTARKPGRTPGPATRPQQAGPAGGIGLPASIGAAFLTPICLNPGRTYVIRQPATAALQLPQHARTDPLKPSSNLDLKRVTQKLSDPLNRRNVLFAGAGVLALAAASAWFLSSSSSQPTRGCQAVPQERAGDRGARRQADGGRPAARSGGR